MALQERAEKLALHGGDGVQAGRDGLARTPLLAENTAFSPEAAILATISDAVVGIDNQQRIRYWNDAAVRRYGVSKTEALGRPLSEIYAWRWDSAEHEAAASLALETLGCWKGENVHVAPDGRRWRVESSVAVLRDGNGERAGLVAVIRDVSAGTHRNAAERTRSKWSQKIFDNAATGIAIWDKQNHFEECNAEYLKLIGYSRDELTRIEVSDFIHPDDLAANVAMIRRLLAGEIPSFEIENRYVQKSGRIVWVHKFVSVIDDEQGRPKLLILVTDVTARKRAESDANFLLGLDKAIAAAENADDRANVAVRLLGEYLGVTRCSFSEFDSRQDVASVTHQWTACEPIGFAAYRLKEFFPGEILASLNAGETIGVADVEADQRTAPFASRLEAFHTQAFAHSTYLHDGEAVALISATHSSRREWSRADLNLLRDVISRVWPAVERARVSEQLRRSEERLRLAAEAAGFGIRDYNAATGRSFWSDEMCDMLGLPRGSEANPSRLLERVHSDDRARVSAALDAALDPRGSGELDVEFRIVRASDRATRWIQKVSRTWFRGTGTGRAPVRTTGILVDITRRKDVEQALSQAVKRLDDHIENSPLAIIHFDAAFRITRWSREAEALFGWRAAEVMGKSIHELRWVHEDDRELVEAAYRGFRDGTRPRVTGVNRNHRKNGSIIECEWHCSAIYNAEGRMEAVLCQVLDLTEKNLTESRLREAQKTETVAVLAGGIAHDFNNLMMTVIGNASLARDLVPSDGPVQPLLQRMMTAGEQAANLTRQMLAYAGKGSFVIEPVDLAQAIDEVWDLMRAGTPREIAIRRDIEPALPWIRADRSQVVQALLNLVRNAAEAIERPAGIILIRSRVESVDESAVLRMDVGEVTPGQYVSLEVRDTGSGMDSETKARMFDPFFSTRFQGRGLGLAAVAGVVRAHGGAIRVVSSPGGGTSVTVLLPIADRQPERRAVVAEWVAGSAAPGTILVIDDDTFVLEFATTALRYAGHRVIAAESAFEGIALLSRQASEIDLIVLDLNMPGMSGHEALPRLFAIAPEIDVLISSGYTEADALERLAGAPVSGVINKPYGTRALTDRVNAVLSSRRRNRNHTKGA